MESLSSPAVSASLTRLCRRVANCAWVIAAVPEPDPVVDPPPPPVLSLPFVPLPARVRVAWMMLRRSWYCLQARSPGALALWQEKVAHSLVPSPDCQLIGKYVLQYSPDIPSPSQFST